MRKKSLITFCLLFASALTGCTTETTEVRERMYIQCMVFEENSEKTVLTLYPFEGAGEPLSGSGKTIYEAVEDAAVRGGKDVFLGHTELLCFKSPGFTEKLQSCLTEYRLSPSCKILYLHETDLPPDTDTTLLTDSLTLEMEKSRIPKTDLFTVLSNEEESVMLIPALTKKGFAICAIGDSSAIPVT